MGDRVWTRSPIEACNENERISRGSPEFAKEEPSFSPLTALRKGRSDCLAVRSPLLSQTVLDVVSGPCDDRNCQDSNGYNAHVRLPCCRIYVHFRLRFEFSGLARDIGKGAVDAREVMFQVESQPAQADV